MAQGTDPLVLKEEGNKLYSQKKFSKALSYYSKALESNFEGQFSLKSILFNNQAACLLELQRYEDAAVACSNCLKLEPRNTKALFRRCKSFEYMQRYEDALRDAVELFEIDTEFPHLRSVFERLNHLLSAQRDTEEGMQQEMLNQFEEQFQQAVHPDIIAQNMEMLNNGIISQNNLIGPISIIETRGYELFKEKKYAEAMLCYTEGLNSLEFSPGSKEVRGVLLQNQIECLFQLKKFPEVVAKSTECLDLLPGKIEALFRRKQAYEAMGHIQDAERDNLILGSILGAQFGHAFMNGNQEQNNAATTSPTNSTPKSPKYKCVSSERADLNIPVSKKDQNPEEGVMKATVNSYQKEGTRLYKEERYLEAEQCYSKALELDLPKKSDKAVLYKNLAGCYMNLKKYEEAASACSECLSLIPNDFKALHKRCKALKAMERLHEAILDAEILINIEPGNEEICILYSELYHSLYEENNAANRAPTKTISTPKSPKYQQVSSEREDLNIPGSKQDPDPGEEDMKAMVHSYQKEGTRLYKEEKYLEAEKCYCEALKLNPPNKADKAVLYKNLAGCYMNLKKYEAAATACSECLSLIPNDFKALLKRCKAFKAMEDRLHEAILDADVLMNIEPDNEEICIMHSELYHRLSEENDNNSNDGDPNTQVIHHTIIPDITSDDDMEKLKLFLQNANECFGEDINRAISHLKDGILFGLNLVRNDPSNMDVRLYLHEHHKTYGRILFFHVKNYFESFIQMDYAAEVCQFSHPFVFREYLPNFVPAVAISDISEEDKQRIFKKQKTRRNSDVFVESQCGFHIAIVFAEKLRQDGVKGFDNELLKNLYLDHAYKLLASIIDFQNSAIQQAAINSCRKALEYSNGRDFEVLRASALIFEQIGHLKEALQCCEEALQINATEELCDLYIQLKEELSGSSDTGSIASSTVSTIYSDSEVDEEWLEGTNIENLKKQTEKAKQKEDQLRKKKRKVKRSRPHRKQPQAHSELEKESCQTNADQLNLVEEQADRNEEPQTKEYKATKLSIRSEIEPKTVPDKSQNESKKPARKPPRINSKRIFNFINTDYEIKLVCEGCWMRESKNGTNSKFIYKFEKTHQCKKSKLLLQHRSSGKVWLHIRSKLFSLSSKDEEMELCEKEVIFSGSCTDAKCKYPHSAAEKIVWQLCLKHNNWNVDALIFDLRNTNLRLMALNVPENVEVFLGCKKCIDENSYETCRKLNRHKSECKNKNKHFWVLETAVTMVKINVKGDNQDEFMHPLESNIQIPDVENGNHIQKFISEVVQLLENKEFKPDEVVQQLDIKKKQQKKEMVKPAHINLKRVLHSSQFSNPRRRNNSSCSLTSLDEEADSRFDTDFSDIVSYEDVEESTPQDNADWEDSKYYIDEPLEILQNHIIEDPETFIKCLISLKGTQSARCYPVDNTCDFDYIEIRGRMNCGKAFDGDLVLVEKMDVELLDSDEKVQRGRVCGVLLEKTNRKVYNFVCTVDGHFSHLMIPVSGKAPKIHVENKQIRDKDDKTKNRLVCVYENNGGRIEYLRRVSINPKDRQNQLFIVKYEKWGNYMYPYGYVVKVIEPGKDLESGQRILDLMYQVPPKYDERTCMYLKAMYDSSNSTVASLVDHASTRCDFTKEYVVSIDPPGCKDIDDALSLSEIPNSSGDACSMYRVGIHIADVTNFVEKDDSVDLEASKRRITFYPADRDKPARHMLPEILSTDICSLDENKERYALSLFADLSADGQVCGKPKFKQTTIINKKKMTYTEAQLLIDGSGETVDNKEALQTIVTLHKVAKALRKNRLKSGFHHREVMEISADYDGAEDAHALVEEFMIFANTEAAKFIVEKYGDKALIRKQRGPIEKKKEEWLNKYQGNIPGFLSLSRFFDDESFSTGNSFHMLKSTFEQLKISSEMEDIQGIIDAVRTENLHPSFIVANSDWLDIQHPACVSLYHSDENNKHFTLQKDLYTWFTSPIRRYVDIIVHRMIKACMEDVNRIQCPYHKEELEDFCDKFNATLRRQKDHDRGGNILKTALFFQKAPAYLPSVVTSFDEDGIKFDWATLPHLKNDLRSLRLSNFSLSDKPDLKKNTRIDMCWQKRIYSVLGKYVPFARSKQLARSKNAIDVHTNRHRVNLHYEKWNELLQEIMNDNEIENDYSSNILGLTADLVNYAELKNTGDGFHDDITSEMKFPNKIVNHHVKFKSTIETGSVIQLQLGCVVTGGRIQPQINLCSVTPSVDICIEHMRDPVHCFSEIATLSHKDKYISVQDYKQTWLPMMSMEAADNAVRDGDSVIINDVPVELTKTKQSFYGVFELRLDFCTHRQINFFANNKDKSESEPSEKDEAQDYICLRIPLKSSASVLPAGRNDLSPHMSWRNVWSAHCVLNPMKSVVTKDKNVRVHFDVHKYTSELPKSLMVEKGKIPATVELITKTLPDRRMEAAVNRLESATEFCQTIILGNTFKAEDQLIDVTVPDSLDITLKDVYLPRNNPTQTKAIRTALQQKFTLIQGPPGTGKTLTGVKLVYWFNELNHGKQTSGNNRRQVMYCGPSNSAVDVATRQMKSRLAEKCPKIVRVYSELLENQVFPLPRDAMVINSRSRRYEMGGKPDLEKISLHHLIRNDPNPFAKKILHFDRVFKKMPPEDISDDQVKDYQKLITDASVHELKLHDVIFCTASVSASPRMLKALNVYQCIIDECGMCMEPETLVPLVSHKPEQVVLIGDHKQLRPIVVNSLARELGLEKSLFERQHNLIDEREKKAWQSKARKRQNTVAEHRSQLGLKYDESQDEVKSTGFIMLDVQYRMHREICAFPSIHFYDGRLRTIETSWWRGEMDKIWPNSKAPIAFCHVEGAEKSLAVSSEEGSENSKSNQLEVDEAVRIYMEFVNKLNIYQKDITILSQYKAQCYQIEKQLKEQGINNPNVSTVVASQGDEWDVVILSTVRSLPRYEIDKNPTVGWLKRNLGFIVDHHQINVALTRARKGLVIIGNKHLLRCDGGEDGLWDKLLNYYESKKAIVDAELFPRRPDEMAERKEIYEGRNWDAKLAPRFRKGLQRQYPQT